MSEQSKNALPVDQVGTPVITLRWRLANKQLVLGKRNFKNLDALLLPDGLIAWIHQHIEWTLPEAVMKDPSGVLVVDIDKDEHAIMDVVAYEPLKDRSSEALINRALSDDIQHKLAPQELIWLYTDGKFIVLCEESKALCASHSLAYDLAKTQRIPLEFDPQASVEDADEVLLISDEHGFVGSDDKRGQMAAQFEEYWLKLTNSKFD